MVYRGGASPNLWSLEVKFLQKFYPQFWTVEKVPGQFVQKMIYSIFWGGVTFQATLGVIIFPLSFRAHI